MQPGGEVYVVKQLVGPHGHGMVRRILEDDGCGEAMDGWPLRGGFNVAPREIMKFPMKL